MKKWFVFHVLLCIAGISQAMDKSNKYLIKLPSAQVLMQRLQKDKFSNFLNVTELDQELGGKNITSLSVLLAVDLALDEYIKSLQLTTRLSMLETVFQKFRWEIIELILRDHPDAVEDLKKIDHVPENRRYTL
ncbi:hypothetical protein E3J79_01130 [Candidatus Dependentiae bacterium]|nr:MAG: hypothetical protein E3J79_01130 [Candidatus Dependentiae bacterium]